MTRCSARGCHNSGGHLFPKDPKLRKKWLQFVQLNEVGKYSVICKGHFRDDDFHELPSLPGLPVPRKRLKASAVPSIKTEYMKPGRFSRDIVASTRRSRGSFKYDTATVRPCSAENVYKPEVLGVTVAVLTENELIQVIECVKDTLVKNAPSTAQFPAKWNQPGPVVKTKRIREGYPPFSMACLSAVAVMSAPDQIASTAHILAFISKNFPCYKLEHSEWQNKVIQTLKVYKLFKKVPASVSPNPKKSYWSFSPDKRTVISPEVYEAFTDPRYDESNIDFSHAVIQTDFEIVSVCKEDILEESLADINQDLEILKEEEEEVDEEAAHDDEDDEEMPEENARQTGRKVTNVVEMDGLEHERLRRDGAMSRLHPSDGNLSDTGTEESEGLDSSTDDDDSSDCENYFLDDYDPSVTLYKCSFCKFTSTDDKITSNHILDKHLSGVVYCCETCNFVSPKTSKLEVHKKSCQGINPRP